jgi:hypothetical protein
MSQRFRIRSQRTALLLVALSLLPSCRRSENGSGDRSLELERTNAALAAELEATRAELAEARLLTAELHGLRFLGDAPPSPSPARRVAVRIDETSPLPEPSTSDYPDCVSVMRATLQTADAAHGLAAGDEILLAVLAFRARKAGPAYELRPGSEVDVTLVPWRELGDDVRSIQRADATDAFDLEMFAALDPRRDEPAATARETVSIDALDPDSIPSPETAIASRIAAIEERLAAHGSFEAWHEELQPLRAGLDARVRANGGPITLERRFTFRGSWTIGRTPEGDWPEPQIAMLRSMREQLAARGIDLILMPFPLKEHLNVTRFVEDMPADGIVDPYREYLHLRLLQEGLEVIDLRPALTAGLDDYEHVFYDGDDNHPAEGALRIAARLAAERLARYELPPSRRTFELEGVRFAVPAEFDAFPEHAHAPLAYAATRVLDENGEPLPRSDRRSPLLLIGDSFLTTPRIYGVASAGLSAHITRHTGVVPRELSVGAGSPQMLVHLAKAGPELLDGVRVCVFAFREGYLYRHDPDERADRWEVVELPKRTDD